MGRMGMQLPGGMRRATPTLNVYTGLLFLAVVALGIACAAVYLNGSLIGPEGNALAVHEAAKDATKSGAELRQGIKLSAQAK